MSKNLKILLADGSRTTEFAAREFIRLSKKMDTDAVVSLSESENADIVIGISDSLPCEKVESKKLDDAITIDIKDGKGYITATNERSVLIAVYRFFTETGGAFVRPGRAGEIIPRKSLSSLTVKLSEAASARYRGFCFEGSAGYNHILELIDFAPKLGFNIFFTQLWRPSFALDRWYNNEKSPAHTPTLLSEEAQDALVIQYEREISLRGLNHHKMGHGWIPSVLGEKTGHWHGISKAGLLKDEHKALVAEINGERKLFNDSAVDTSFCYSNPEARRLIVDEVVKYALENRETDTLHVWLADQPNNQCECERCKDTLPSEFYVDMLNEIDEEFTKHNIDTRVVFLSYLELFWTPKRARIKNPERFILLFAPIRRPYHRPLRAQKEGRLMPFIRNGWINPCTSYSALCYLDEWKKQFPGECILFDYHLMWDCYNDIVGEESGMMLAEDMLDLSSLGMDGMISCQGTRLGFIGAIPMLLMAKALWSGKIDCESEIESFYKASYGEDSDICRQTLKKICLAVKPNALRDVEKLDDSHLDVINDAKKAIKEIYPTVWAHLCDKDFAVRTSYIYLSEMLRLADLLCDFLTYAIRKDESEALKVWSEVLASIKETEALYPAALDAFEFALVWHRHILPIFFPGLQINYDSGELTM